MIRHALLRFKDMASAAQIDALITAIGGLRARISGVAELTCSADFGGRSQGYSRAVAMTSSDRAGLAAFLPHPAHRSLAGERIEPFTDDLLIMGFKFATETPNDPHTAGRRAS